MRHLHEGGPHELVEASIADNERMASRSPHINDPGHVGAAPANQVAPELEDEFDAA